jgi:hypothetical protein
MRKASTRLPEQGTQAPSPAPDLIPAKTENQPRTYTAIGTANGGTSPSTLTAVFGNSRSAALITSTSSESASPASLVISLLLISK